MSGFWIKWTVGLERKPEIMRISARLMIPAAHAAGCLMLVMQWLDAATQDADYDENGNARVTLGALPINFIDGVAGVSGFAEALAEVGWLKKDGDFALFVNAGRHNGKTGKSRALTRERVAAHRNSELKRSCNAPIVTNSLLFSDQDQEGGNGGNHKSGIQLRAEALFKRRPGTAWDASTKKAWENAKASVRDASEDEWLLLEWFYALPYEGTFRRKDLATLLNNWSAEIDRARSYRLNVGGGQAARRFENVGPPKP